MVVVVPSQGRSFQNQGRDSRCRRLQDTVFMVNPCRRKESIDSRSRYPVKDRKIQDYWVGERFTSKEGYL